nr:hypothetical protein GCM10020185_66770 [Pseudomonas brassicacearum subsp. brassicacearum]
MQVMDKRCLVDVQQVGHVYGTAGGAERRVLDNVCMRLDEGEIVGLLGRSGSGKSTLLRSIAGLISPTSGVVDFSKQCPRAGELGAHGVPELRPVPLADGAAKRRGRPRGPRRGGT